MFDFSPARMRQLASAALIYLLLLCHQHEVLGHGDAKRSRRTVGGTVIDDAARWPWLVSLHGNIPIVRFFGITWSSRRLACGGSLISRRVVLTAAHCFVRPALGPRSQVAQYWTARMGDINRESSLIDDIRDIIGEVFDNDNYRDWDIDGQRILINPSYSEAEKWKSDMALLVLSRDAPIARYRVPTIQSVEVDRGSYPGFPSPTSVCVFKGWGCTRSGGPLSPVARQVSLSVVNDDVCRRQWNMDVSTRICAGDSRSGVCSGDSGGPLVCQRGNTWVQVGVASFTSSSGSLPPVFARVSSAATWIQRHVNTYG